MKAWIGNAANSYPQHPHLLQLPKEPTLRSDFYTCCPQGTGDLEMTAECYPRVVPKDWNVPTGGQTRVSTPRVCRPPATKQALPVSRAPPPLAVNTLRPSVSPDSHKLPFSKQSGSPSWPGRGPQKQKSLGNKRKFSSTDELLGTWLTEVISGECVGLIRFTWAENELQKDKNLASRTAKERPSLKPQRPGPWWRKQDLETRSITTLWTSVSKSVKRECHHPHHWLDSPEDFKRTKDLKGT